MLSREDIAVFLANQAGKSKEEVLSNFASYAIVNGVPVDKLGKIIMDLRSYSGWSWGN